MLTYHGHKLAVIEAKKRDLPDTEGVGQAKKYAGNLQARFAYSTNGLGIYRIDMQTGQEDYVSHYPSPDELWAATFPEENPWRNRFAEFPFEDKSGTWQARYYQHNAITNALEAIAAGQDRILLTLATGTGKTCIAFQIAWKLFRSRWTLAKDSQAPAPYPVPCRPQYSGESSLSRFYRLPGGRPGPDRPRYDPQARARPKERQHLLHHLPDLHDRPGCRR